MPDHSPVAPATSQTPSYRSLASYAKDSLCLIEELNEIGSVLLLLVDTCHDRYEEDLGHALTLISKSQHNIYRQLKATQQVLAEKTAGLQTQGAQDAP